jgi:hypothetical protein
VSGEDDQPGVVVAPGTAEEANRVATALRAGGFHPTVDYARIADRLGKFPVLVPHAELGEAKGFLKGLRASQAIAPVVAATPSLAAPPPKASGSWAGLPPTAGRALVLLTGLLVVVGGVVGLASMLQFLNSLRDH